MIRSSFAFLATVLVATASPAAPVRAPDGGHGIAASHVHDQVSDALEQRIAEEVARNLQALDLQAQPSPPAAKVAGLAWPLGPFPGAGVDLHGISNFVDLDSAFPNQLRDYTCAARTYDNANGYNHRGTDFFIWPFGWTLMDAGTVDVRAAAPGVLVARDDGNDDRSCSFNAPDTPNYAIVQHADGTVAWYLHMKRDTVTQRPIGSQIAAGEVLGKVGSSGVSTGPHLHFELRAGTSQNAAVIDPFNGQCNTSASAWAAQRPYRDGHVNQLSTHGVPPALADCPSTVDTPNFKDTFQPGDPVIFLAAYRDQAKGQPTQFRVLRPDASEFMAWSFDLASQAGAPDAYNGSYWYWSNSLPANAPHGLWAFEAEHQGETTRHYFRVGDTTSAIADPRGLIGVWYEPATSGQGLELHWIEGDTLLVFFYGHRDNGENMYLLGVRSGRFDYGQPIEMPLGRAVNGTFNGFDREAIQRPEWGSLRLTFDSCTAATAELDGEDGLKILQLQRIGRTPGLDCD